MQVQAISDSKDRPRDPRNQEVVHVAGDPQNGNLATPINSSGFTEAYINNLPAYRKGLSPGRRGLEIGMAHGYWLIGPFAKLGPLRDSDVANLAGLLATVGLIVILTIALSLYASSNPPQPVATITNPHPSDSLSTQEGWNEFASNFLIGGIGGAGFAYLLISNLEVLQSISSNLFN
ncbi:photosystem I reaction center subunit XI [Microcoleus sp. FACHB-831]|uniref:photosystem I reaction center subunit XI n=1 Tax=Microcoleus sp. FACHB-831 TaxID=2692827 RepID=UPI001686F3E9|nr:photosystem I reaction center subunit XI [Microcoleus sp. FACHB-831]MBD1921836.1 photosystem I reaction center subunit XI [Microcoleus sp. FACHB-831]